MHRQLYLLMEIADREFEGKLLLAFHAAHRGWKVLICPRLYFFDNIGKFPEGVVLYKSITSGDLPLVEQVKKHGHRFLCIDEEGIVQRDEAYKLQISYGNECFKAIDQLFLLNEKQKRILLENYTVGDEKISVTGYPRLEFLRILRDKDDNDIVKKILNRYGRFIFFPTSFPYANHIQGKFGLDYNFYNVIRDLTREKIEFFNGIGLFQKYVQKEYEKLIYEISQKFPEINIVLRPHPSEDSNYWIKKYQKHDNIIVDYQYPATYYIKASELVVQYGSTISIEANILNKPCFQFDPSLPEELERFAVKEALSYVNSMGSIDQVFDGINQIMSLGQKELPGNKYEVRDDAAESIVEIMDNKYSDLKKAKEIVHKNRLLSFNYKRRLRYCIFWVIAKTGLLNLMPQKRLKGKFLLLKKESKLFHLNAFQYLRRKNGKITMNRIDESIKMFSDNWPEFDRTLKIKEVAFNSFEIKQG